jgi:biotin carboxylase
VRLHLIASKPTDSVTYGFLPAAARLGLEVILLTDQPEAHERVLARAHAPVRPGPGAVPAPAAASGPGAMPGPGAVPGPGAMPGPRPGRGPEPVRPAVVACDPWDARALIARMAALPAPDAVFSNSDHLQAQTALAADYFGLPGKDWRSALRAKDKILMRRRLAETGAERVTATEITKATRHPLDLPYPVVLKPAEGVASEDVVLVGGPGELARHTEQILARRPGERLIAEEYLPGSLRTLETVGDGLTVWSLGGFRTDVSPPPFFIEERLTWDAAPFEAENDVLAALAALGVSFGACHTEYVLEPGGRPRLIEVNDRLIGDHGDFLLTGLLGLDVFELGLRLHLGQILTAGPPQARGHAIADYVVADRAGRLTACPPAGPQPGTEPGVALSYWPLRSAGDHVALTHTNRDYLGVISALGPDPAAVERSVAALRGGGHWRIDPEHAIPRQARPGQAGSGQAGSGQAGSGQAGPGQTRPGQAGPQEAGSQEAEPPHASPEPRP